MLKAAVEAKAEGICHPILLGNDERIEKLAKELDLSLEGIEIINLRHDREAERRERYARILSKSVLVKEPTFRSKRQNVRAQLFRYDDGRNR